MPIPTRLFQLDVCPYRLEPAPSDYHDDDGEFHKTVLYWLSNQAADLYEDGIQKLVVLYDTCYNIGGNYVDIRIKFRYRIVYVILLTF